MPSVAIEMHHDSMLWSQSRGNGLGCSSEPYTVGICDGYEQGVSERRLKDMELPRGAIPVEGKGSKTEKVVCQLANNPEIIRISSSGRE